MVQVSSRPPEGDLVTPSKSDERTLEALRRLLEGSKQSALVVSGKKPVDLPSVVQDLLLKTVRELASGKAVSLVAVERDLTTQQAADLLNVSRPYLISLLEKGELPFHKIGTHRRVPLIPLLEYRKHRDEARRSVLRQMARESREHGLYES